MSLLKTNRALALAAALLMAAPAQAARTFYHCTVSGDGVVETMSIDPEAASATYEGKPADLQVYDWGYALTQRSELGDIVLQERINFYPNSLSITVFFAPISSDGAGPPSVLFGKCVVVPRY